MTILGTRLELPEGTVLTSVQIHDAAFDRLRPRWPRAGSPSTVEAGTLYLHRIDVPPDEDIESMAASLVAHMPDGVVALSGLHADGYGWVATCQLALADHRFVTSERAAESAVRRAIDIVGLDDWPRAAPLYTTGDLRESFGRWTGAGLGAWGIDLLLLGAVAEMTGTPLDEVVEYAEHVPWEPVSADASHEQVEERLRELIDGWDGL